MLPEMVFRVPLCGLALGGDPVASGSCLSAPTEQHRTPDGEE